MAYKLSSEASRAAQLAQALRSSEQRISLAAEAANMGFWSRESAHTDLWATDQWRALFGFASSDRLHLDDVLQRLHPDDREITRQRLANAFQGDGHYQSEYRVLLPNGQVRWVATNGRIEVNGRGEPLRLQGVSLDITKRKQAELEAQAHRGEVAHLLRVANLGELSSSLAHELKQPLSAILNNAQAAQLFLAGDVRDMEPIRDILRDIVTDDERANEVIERLHALLRKGEYQPAALAPAELIQSVLKLLHHELIFRAVRVVTELDSNMPLIRGDRVQLQQVLINLISNGMDAVSVSAGNARTLTLRASRPEAAAIKFSVADAGSGIAPGCEEKIFEPYYTTKPRGLGLGLSLSRSIVLAHGGNMWAENRHSLGATIHFTVPTYDESPPKSLKAEI